MSGIGVTGVRQVALSVRDVDKAKGFYVGILGLTHLFDAGPELSFLDAGGLRIMLAPPEGGADAGKNSTLYYQVDDLDKAHAGAVSQGAEKVDDPHLIANMPDHELWMAFLRDPDGNLVGLLEERRPS